jgi:hypothetical protein
MAAPAQTNLASAASVADGLRDIKGPMMIPTGWEWLWWTLGALAVIGALLTLALLIFKRRKLVVEPPLIPAHERARQKLEAALELFDQPKPFCIIVSDAVRLYLEERFGLHAPDRTTDEFLADLGKSSALTVNQKESLQEFLSACDLVKFAKYEPQRPELEVIYKSALRLIEETAPAEVASSRPATPSQHPA